MHSKTQFNSQKREKSTTHPTCKIVTLRIFGAEQAIDLHPHMPRGCSRHRTPSASFATSKNGDASFSRCSNHGPWQRCGNVANCSGALGHRCQMRTLQERCGKLGNDPTAHSMATLSLCSGTTTCPDRRGHTYCEQLHKNANTHKFRAAIAMLKQPAARFNAQEQQHTTRTRDQ